MDNNILSGVEDTLFIPLIARIEISKRFPEYFYDEKALSINSLPHFEKIVSNSSEYSMMASVSRAVTMDKTVNAYISRHKKCNIVCIGCGLETMAWRVAEGAHFYEVDFPSVIENRKNILGTKENETLISGNVNEIDLSEYMDISSPTLFVVAGVFQYFKEDEVLALIAKLQKQFSNAQLLFDSTNETGIKYAQKHVKKTGNQNAMMHFYINDPQNFTNKANTQLLSVSGFFDNARRQLKSGLKLFTKIAMKVADEKKRTLIIHLKL